MGGRLNVIATVVHKMRVEDLEMLDIVGAVFCADFLILSNQAPDLHPRKSPRTFNNDGR